MFVEQVAELKTSPEPFSDEATNDIRVALGHFDLTVNAIKRAAEILPYLRGQVEELENVMQTVRDA